jgi:hypothetical protein
VIEEAPSALPNELRKIIGQVHIKDILLRLE